VTLPEAELSFYFAALAQIEPARRPVFTERVTRLLGAHPNPGPGDVDRAVRQALVGLWTPPAIEEFQRLPRWDRATPAFERVSKQLRRACGLSVDSWGVVHELSIGGHVRN
jgi:hypothetical protein